MSTRSVSECDICGVEIKGDSGWKTALTKENVFVSVPMSVKEVYIEVISEKDACGREHAQKFFERYLDHGTLEERVPDEKKVEVEEWPAQEA